MSVVTRTEGTNDNVTLKTTLFQKFSPTAPILSQEDKPLTLLTTPTVYTTVLTVEGQTKVVVTKTTTQPAQLLTLVQ